MEILDSKYDYYADVILPLALEQNYTYRVPADLLGSIHVGSRIVVPFQKGARMYTGIIEKLHHNKPKNYEARYLEQLLDEEPFITEQHIALWQWISAYYLCTTGEVMNAALPAALKLNSETSIRLVEGFSPDIEQLSDKEYLIVEALQIQAELSIQEIQKIIEQKSVLPLVRAMMQKGIIHIEEALERKYQPKVISCIRIAEKYEQANELSSLFTSLEKKVKQLEALQCYLSLRRNKDFVSQKDIMLGASIGPSPIQTLVKNGIFEVYEQVVSRLHLETNEDPNLLDLSEEQQNAEVQIAAAFAEAKPVLLHGITSSGKTMLYVRQIKKALAENKQALILIPEIGLSTQLVERYKNLFADAVVVYHSKYSDNERAEVWQEVAKGNCRIVLGTRSSIFLPFQNLGLIVVDEEHDSSYKQQEPAPRYQARDVALYMAKQLQIPIILGSATPCIESYHNALTGKYQLVKLQNRYGGVSQPEIKIAAMQRDFSQVAPGIFGKTLVDAIEVALRNKEQIILFQNRRGYAPYLQCHACGHAPNCVNCDVSLSYHKFKNEMRCHYCGYHHEVPKTCQACGSSNLELKGTGTQKIEDELLQHFPQARVARMDLDTTRQKRAFQELLDEFEDGNIDILVGTQMVTKGLDFPNLRLVGIVQADHLLCMPDFRAHERAYQLLEQVSGRAGRRDKQGVVVVQSYQPEHPVLQQMSRHDYIPFVKQQIEERKQFLYPPFVRLIEITIKHIDFATGRQAAMNLKEGIKKYLALKNILGPEVPSISRVRGQYLQKIVLKLDPKEINLDTLKQALRFEIAALHQEKNHSKVRVICDVDPG